MSNSTNASTTLSADEIRRYARHLTLSEVGVQGQRRLREAKVLVVGSGGLGSPVAFYLAAAGVGTLGMVDFDLIELSNLHRQILHSTEDIGRSKLWSAEKKIHATNPHVRFVPYELRLNAQNALEIIRDYDLVVDATDNFPTRYLINDACVLLGKTYIYGSVYRFEGMVSVFAAHLGGPCYRCWYPELPPAGAIPNCAEGGVLGAVCGIIGTLQANEAIKWILGKGRSLTGCVLSLDALGMDFREIRIKKDPDCCLCGPNATLKELSSYELSCEKELPMSDDVSAEYVSSLLKQGHDFVFIDVRNPDEHAIGHINGTQLLPLPELPRRFQEIPRDKLVVLHCHHGGRSKRALDFLRSQGYSQIKNLAGGIDRWSQIIDPSIPRY